MSKQAIDRDGFTYQELLDVQASQLAGWKKVLTADAHAKLVNYATQGSYPADCAAERHWVIRGIQLDSFIHNNLINDNPEGR